MIKDNFILGYTLKHFIFIYLFMLVNCIITSFSLKMKN